MREITRDAVTALKSNQEFTRDNTTVRVFGNGRERYAEMRLHGHMVAATDEHGTLYVSLAGHPTLTTRERVNGALERWGLPVRVVQRHGTQYLRHLDTGKKWELNPKGLVSEGDILDMLPDRKGE